MADVSVEFGAKDTGLEQTLKTVQDELAKLEGEVKSGELSFDALQQTMRKLAQTEKLEAQLQAMADGMDKAGSSASAADPKLNSLGNEAREMGNKVEGAGKKTDDSAGLFDAGFAKISAAFTVGNLAAKGFEAIVNGVFSAARAIVDGFGEALDLGGRLSDLSARTGETAGNMLILETAFKNSGLAADQAGQVINKLQSFMQDAANGGETQTGVMNKLGISMDQLAGKTPTEQMQLFAQRISAIQDPTERAATASDIFGERLGGKLLPLLRDFAPMLDDSRDKVGSLAEVMDESAVIFDAAGETIDAVGDKLAAFSAGILSETIPALGYLGKSMEEVDAAGLGKEIGEALAPVVQELADATVGAADMLAQLRDETAKAAQQARSLANDVGVSNEALSVFGLVVKMAGERINPVQGAMAALSRRGKEVRESADDAAEGVQAVGDAATEVAPVLEATSGSAERFATSLQDIGIDSAGAFSDINNGATQFNTLLGESNVALSDMGGSISSQIPLQTEQVALVGQLNTSLGEANIRAGEQLAKIEQQISAEQRRNEMIAARQEKSLADYELQIQINEALAAGNTSLAESLEYQRELTALTEKIMRDTGLSAAAAGILAANLLASRDAAREASQGSEPLKNNIKKAGDEADNVGNNLRTVKDIIDDIKQQEMDNPMKSFKERTREAQSALSDMKDFIGIDMENMSLSSIIDKFGIDSFNIRNTQDQLEAVEGVIKGLEAAEPADLTPDVDAFGFNKKLDKIKEYLNGLESDKADATPEIDTDQVRSEADGAKKTIDEEMASPVDLTLEADQSINKIRDQLKEEIDMSLSSSKGTGHLSSIDKLVSKIQELVIKIERKLPMQALA